MEIFKIFVSPTGNDSANGKEESPFKTISAAKDYIFSQIQSGALQCEAEICISEGDYYENIEIDGQIYNQNITFTALPGEKVRIVGGKRLIDIKKVEDKNVLERLKPEVREKTYEFSFSKNGIAEIDEFQLRGHSIEKPAVADVRLLKNGELMTPASYPSGNEYIYYDKVLSQPEDLSNPFRTDPITFSFNCENPKKWANLEDIWMYGHPTADWADYFGRIYDLDVENMTFKIHQPYNLKVKDGRRFRFVNILEELDCENEFYIDRKNSKIYIISSNLQGNKYEIALSKKPLLKISDSKNITVKGITFSLSRKTAVQVENSENVNIKDCIICDTLKDAIHLKNCFNCEVFGNHIFNIGEAGITAECGSKSELLESGVRLINNEIHDFAKIYEMYQPGIKIRGYGNYIAHNEVYNTVHSAVLFSGNCNIFEYNNFHNCLKKTADAGVIYCGMSWTDMGNVIRYNYIHDCPVSTGAMTTKGVYLDDVMLGNEIYSNIFENLESGVYSHGGREAVIKNNIFINCRKHSVRIFSCWSIAQPGRVEKCWIEPTRKWIKENPKWSKKFPEAEKCCNDLLGMFPMYNTVVGNISINSPEVEVGKYAIDTATMRDNIVTDDENIFADFKNRNYTIGNIEKIKSLIPGFDAVEFNKIGLLDKKREKPVI